jgi:hypothetical protein
MAYPAERQIILSIKIALKHHVMPDVVNMGREPVPLLRG